MYKFLLSTRYLQTKIIALASIISVTLGVATMIVVNSVMAGFSTEMKGRIHGILADIMIESTSMDGTENPQRLIDEVIAIAGDDIEAITPTMEIFGMMSFEWSGQTIYRPVTLIGIVPEGKNSVSPLAQYLNSRQRIMDDNVVIREPLRDVHAPLDWSLTDEAMKSRVDWIEWQEFNRQFNGYGSTSSTPATPVALQNPNASTPQNAVQTASNEAPPLLGDPFLVNQASAEQPSSFEGGELENPFTNSGPQENTDPTLPLKGRVYVGSGLVTFPYTDEETGKTEIMNMTQPGHDLNFTTISAGIPDPVSFPATLVDIFQSGMSEYDSNLVFCNLEELQRVRGMLAVETDPSNPTPPDWRNGEITTLQIKLKDYADAPVVINKLQANLSDRMRFQIRTWEEKQGPLLEAVAVESAILNVLLFLIIAVAGFGILAIFSMIVIEKTRDIGIMKALGATSNGILTIFISYGLALGAVGASAGVGLGLLFVYYINDIEKLISYTTGREVFDEKIYYFKEIPVSVNPQMVVWVAFGAMAIAVIASILPAVNASRLHPVKSLRYE